MWQIINLGEFPDFGIVLLVTPKDDIKNHITKGVISAMCSCKPKIIIEKNGIIISHNAFYQTAEKDYSQIILPYLIEISKAKLEGNRETFRQNMKKQVSNMLNVMTSIFN